MDELRVPCVNSPQCQSLADVALHSPCGEARSNGMKRRRGVRRLTSTKASEKSGLGPSTEVRSCNFRIPSCYFIYRTGVKEGQEKLGYRVYLNIFLCSKSNRDRGL